MANTFDPALIVDVASEKAITVLQPILAPLDVFTTDFSDDVVKSGQTIQVPIATETSAVQVDPTNFEQGDTTLAPIAVSLSHLSKSFHLTNAERRSGHKLSQLLEINMKVVANAVMDYALAPVDGTNYTKSAIGTAGAIAAADFDQAELVTLFGEVPDADPVSIVMDTPYFAKFLPANLDAFDPTKSTTGIFGFDQFNRNNRWTGGVANLAGFVCAPQAIACAAAVPEVDELVGQELYSSTQIPVGDLGISLTLNMWGSTVSRASWASFDIAFGASMGDETALVYWTSA